MAVAGAMGWTAAGGTISGSEAAEVGDRSGVTGLVESDSCALPPPPTGCGGNTVGVRPSCDLPSGETGRTPSTETAKGVRSTPLAGAAECKE